MDHPGNREHRDDHRTSVDRGLRLQIRIFLAIFGIMAVLVVVHVVRDGVDPWSAVAGLAAGLPIGAVLARLKVLSWNPSERVVVGTIDAVGLVILIAYLVFILARNRIIGEWVEDAPTVGAVGLAVIAGVMVGRVVATVRGIRRVLAAAGIGPGEGP